MKLDLYLFLIALGIFFLSCHSKKQNSVSADTDTLLNKTIVFPDSLTWLKDGKFYPLDSALYLLNDKRKVISIVDGICIKCVVNQLNKLDSSIYSRMDYSSLSEVVFILDVNPKDSSYFMLNIQPYIKARGIILWDNAYHFEQKNKLLTAEEWLRTFMVDENNKIILYGNPLMKPWLINEYEIKLRSLQ